MKAKSLQETWDQLSAQAPCLSCPGTSVDTGLVGRTCQQMVWETSPALREFATLALEMTKEAARDLGPWKASEHKLFPASGHSSNRQKPGELTAEPVWLPCHCPRASHGKLPLPHSLTGWSASSPLPTVNLIKEPDLAHLLGCPLCLEQWGPGRRKEWLEPQDHIALGARRACPCG